MAKKDFANALGQTIKDLTGGKISEPAALDPLPEPEKKEYVKIILRMEKDLHAALQQIALNQAAKKGVRYSLTELINDILKEYLSMNREK